MKRYMIALALILALVQQPALADHAHHGYRHHNVDPGMAIFGGIVGGLIIGGMINSMNQPMHGYVPQPQYRQICRTQFVTQYDAYYNEYIQVPIQQCRWTRAY